MKQKILIAVFSVVLLAAALVTALAVSGTSEKTGDYKRDIVDRVSFYADATQFSFVRSENADEVYELGFQLTAEKTEADFYALLHSAELDGLDYDTMVFQSATGENLLPEELPLPAENGNAIPVQWTVRVRFPAPEDQNTVDFSLVLNYTSGMTPDTAEEYILKIPMRITFE